MVELTEFKIEGYELIRQSTLLVAASVANIKNKKDINFKDLDDIKDIIEKIKEFKIRLDSIFEDIEKSENIESDLIKINEIGNSFSDWAYDFTSKVMDRLATLKEQFETITCEHPEKNND